MPSVNMIRIPVQMGSNKIQIELTSDSIITCKQFISIVLDRCNIDAKLARTYAIFESDNGIEKRLHSCQQLLEIFTESQAKKSVFFVVRKYFVAEKRIVQNMDSIKHKEMVKKCFKKMKTQGIEESNENCQSQRRMHLSSIEKEYLKRAAKDQKSNKKQSVAQVIKVVKPVQCEPVFQQEANLAANINILQFLYGKLKKQNIQQSSRNANGSYEKLIDNDSCGNSSDEESSSVGSHNSGSNLHAFESLI